LAQNIIKDKNLKGMITISLKDMNDLMRIQAFTLYVLDDKDKIVSVNEPGETSAPLIFIGKTRNSILKYFKNDLPQPVIDEINHQITQKDLNILCICKILEKYKTLKNVWIGPAYSFPDTFSTPCDKNIGLITESNRHYLTKYFSDINDNYEQRTPIMAYIIDGEAVSICCCARRSNRAIEASLYTVEPYRGKGFADKVVNEWGREVAKLGYIPLYSTSWENLSSQRVAQKLGLIQYGMDFSITAD
jgi:GNAT superfamily N-acetyltransferase